MMLRLHPEGYVYMYILPSIERVVIYYKDHRGYWIMKVKCLDKFNDYHNIATVAMFS